MYAPSKVCKLDRTKAVEQVLWLDVPVDYILRVDVLEGLAHLRDVVRRLGFRVARGWLTFQVFVELTLRAVLKD